MTSIGLAFVFAGCGSSLAARRNPAVCALPDTNLVIADQQEAPSWLASTNDWLVWATPDRIMIADRCISDPSVIAPESALRIAADAANVYWTRTIDGTHTELRAASAFGGPRDAGAVTLSASPAPDPLSTIALDAGYAYYGSSEGVVRVSKRGGPAMVIESDLPVTFAVAVDDAHVYFGSRSGLMRVAKAGGVPTKLAPPSGPSIGSIVVDASGVYWTTATPPFASGWTVSKVAKDGGDVTVLSSDEAPIVDLAVDGGDVYWSTSAGPLVRWSHTTRTTIPEASSRAGIVAGDSMIAWADHSGGRVMGRVIP